MRRINKRLEALEAKIKEHEMMIAEKVNESTENNTVVVPVFPGVIKYHEVSSGITEKNDTEKTESDTEMVENDTETIENDTETIENDTETIENDIVSDDPEESVQTEEELVEKPIHVRMCRVFSVIR